MLERYIQVVRTDAPGIARWLSTPGCSRGGVGFTPAIRLGGELAGVNPAPPQGTEPAPGGSAVLGATAIATGLSDHEEPAATRERLKTRFAPGAVRRMTQLGLLVGAVLGELEPGEEDTLVYASQFGESRALEGYLDSFPSASPTLFQTSIHPSGAQQGLIGRQRSVREFFPLAGGAQLVASAVQAALLAASERALFCGGEECGTWLVASGAASDRAFAFALALTRTQQSGTVGRIALEPMVDATGALALADWFEFLHNRRPFAGAVAPGWRLLLEWL